MNGLEPWAVERGVYFMEEGARPGERGTAGRCAVSHHVYSRASPSWGLDSPWEFAYRMPGLKYTVLWAKKIE